MSELRIAQMLDGQLQSADPFIQARNIYDQRQSVKPEDMSMLGSVLNPKQNDQMKPTVPPVNEAMTTVGSLNTAPIGEFEQSGIPKMLQKIGVDDKNLAMNQLGRMQLVGRLQKKFSDYSQNPEALDILSKFDENIKRFSMDNQKDLNKTISNGERTLKALLGGA